MTLALEHDAQTGFTVTGEGFVPGEHVTVLVKTIGSARQAVVDQEGAFRVVIGAVAPAAGVRALDHRHGRPGSRATLVLPRPSRLH